MNMISASSESGIILQKDIFRLAAAIFSETNNDVASEADMWGHQ